METSQLEQAIELVEKLPQQDQKTLVEVIKRRLSERRRSEIAQAAAETLRAVQEGNACYGSVEDLKRDLLSEP